MDKKKYSKAIGNNQLTPITSPWMHNLMASSQIVEELFEIYGSPLNLHHIPSFLKNITAYQKVFSQFGIDGQIYFARKANKSQSLVKAALEFGIGVDTASYKELEQAIALGGTVENIILTAAIKNKALMRLAIQNDIPIIMDNLDELQLANQLAQEMGGFCNIGIRLSGFSVGDRKLYSRFGFDIEKDLTNLKVWFSDKATFPNLKLKGFHFHLDGYSIEERGEASIQTMKVIQEFRQQGNTIEFMDIGGGILMNYLESKKEWDIFQMNLKNSIMGKAEYITFNNTGLGFELSGNSAEVIGKLKTYPYFNELNGANFLSKVLSYKSKYGPSVAEQLNQANIQFRIEPGRSLLNQVGMTIAEVAHRKLDAKGNWLVGLEMNMSQLRSSSADYLVDPYVIYKAELDTKQPSELYFTGAYCLEQDVLLKRKLAFPSLPARGDYVVFVNTAGYMMHFYETEAHLFELSQNLFIKEENEKFKFKDFYIDNDVSDPNGGRKTEAIIH